MCCYRNGMKRHIRCWVLNVERKGYQTKLGNERKRRLFKAGTIIFLVIAAALVFNKILEEWTGFRKVLDTITGAAAPIIIGFVIAFLLNPVLIFLIVCVIRSCRIG